MIPFKFKFSNPNFLARSIVTELLESFLSVEEAFRLGGPDGPTTEQEAVDTMRKVGNSNLATAL